MKYICWLHIHIKSVLWRVAKRLSYKEDARCLKVNKNYARCLPWLRFQQIDMIRSKIFNFCCFPALIFFYIHGSVHPDSILIRYNKMKQYAGIYLLQNNSTCFECPSHPSSGEHKTVTAASGTGHSIWVTTFLQRGLYATL